MKEQRPTWIIEKDDRLDERIIRTLIGKAFDDAMPTPTQSSYPVRAAVVTDKGRYFSGGNHEYGLGRSLHAEETVVARAIEENPRYRLVALALIAGEPGNIATPCGNCRDFLNQYTDPELIIVSGSPKGGQVAISKLNDYLFNEFKETEIGLTLSPETIAAEARKATTLYSPSMTPYLAVLTPLGGEHLFGTFDGDAAYHPTQSIQCAIKSLQGRVNQGSPLASALIIIAEGKPKVPYLDRQHLTEHLARQNAYLEITNPVPLPIRLVDVDQQGKPQRMWETNSDEWIPHPFSPSNLGKEKELKTAIANLLPGKNP
ncbi:MAG: hypothetical protein ABIH34_05390 [Nanoarchaeota archaeon]